MSEKESANPPEGAEEPQDIQDTHPYGAYWGPHDWQDGGPGWDGK